ncbi:hypothetical protein KC19_9G068200 [Ceratodon purpureus]|uniref:Protein kinase domain-containing protein n=1 Tax=Ceratodon purpureus TaxID=3225 RepID=A0A8T0GUX3_CERPU|nr:hypothetical protein KC19_9G068200 [Ceratodon purpureus]
MSRKIVLKASKNSWIDVSNTPHTEAAEGRMGILSCNFYRNQSRVLKKQLSDAEEILTKHISHVSQGRGTVSSVGLRWPQSTLLELLRMLKAGKALIEGCHDDPCFKAYLRWTEMTLAFAETMKEIIWCMSVGFYSNKKRCSQGNPFTAMDEFPLAELGACKELYMLQMAASDDERELLKAVDMWIEKHRCSVKECGGPQQPFENPPFCIATQIWERRNEEKKKVGDAGIETSFEVDHTSILWNINSKILPEDGKFIGSGAFCSVIETTWLGDTYAKKNFRMENPAVFETEANALSRLTHPHMVTVLAYSVDAESLISSLLMERFPYDLRQYMTKRQKEGINPPFKILAAVDLMLQWSQAMMYMHSEGMVHRDLKPGNVLVKPVDDPELWQQGFVTVAKLADFGLAKLKNEVTNYSHMTKNQGTRTYMAPEVFRADEDDHEHSLFAFPRKADVWSFGIVCSEILTGKAPFQNVNFKMGDLYKLLTDLDNPLRPELPESCPEELASLIRDCWHTDPMRRPDFKDICKTLRHLKGVMMLEGDGQLEPWMETKLRSLVDVELKYESRFKQLSNTGSHDIPYCLFYTTFDGSSWTTAVPSSLPHPEMASPNGMSLADHHGTLVGVHRAADEWKFSRNLYWNTYTGTSWTRPQIMESQTSPSRPAVATFGDRLYCLYRGEGNEIWCTSLGSNLNDLWTPAVDVGGVYRTSDGPALASYRGCLISVIRGLDNYVYWDVFNGLGWRGYEEMKNGAFTSGSPALAVYKNELYCCIRGMDGYLHWGRYFGTDWFALTKLVDYQLGVVSGPSLAVFNNQLVCTLEGPDNKFYYTTFDGLRWSQVRKVPFQSSCTGEQGLCTYNSKLFCVYGVWPV